jgi:hypothetical protein
MSCGVASPEWDRRCTGTDIGPADVDDAVSTVYSPSVSTCSVELLAPESIVGVGEPAPPQAASSSRDSSEVISRRASCIAAWCVVCLPARAGEVVLDGGAAG